MMTEIMNHELEKGGAASKMDEIKGQLHEKLYSYANGVPTLQMDKVLGKGEPVSNAEMINEEVVAHTFEASLLLDESKTISDRNVGHAPLNGKFNLEDQEPDSKDSDDEKISEKGADIDNKQVYFFMAHDVHELELEEESGEDS